MPKRTDISSILIIGAGPIVIGQACEFDYSGTQACKALRAEGYRIVLVNSNPATIMTDPDLADATYVEPITPEIVAKIIEKERPDALLPTMGGQTALNTALSLKRMGVLDRFGVEMIGADAEAIDKAEDRQLFREAMAKIGLETPKSRLANASALKKADRAAYLAEKARLEELDLHPGDRKRHPVLLRAEMGGGRERAAQALRRARARRGLDGARRHRPAGHHPPLLHPRRHRRRHRLQPRGVPGHRRARPRRLADERGPDRGIGARLEGVRDGGGPRPGGQLHHRLLHRERRPDGRPYGRFHHRRPGADADGQGIPDHARRLDRGAARDRGGDRRLQRPVRGEPRRRPHGRDRDEPARVALLGAGVEGDGIPDRQGRGAARGRLHPGRDRQRHHGRGDPGLLRADHRLRRHQDPPLRLREIPGGRADPDHLHEVGRRGDGDRAHFRGKPAEGPALAGNGADGPRRDRDRGFGARRRPQRRQGRARHPDAGPAPAGGPGPSPRLQPGRGSRILPDRPLVPGAASVDRRHGGQGPPARPAAHAGRFSPAQGDGLLRRAPRRARAQGRGGGAGAPPLPRRPPGVQAHRHLRRRVRLAHRLHVLHLRRALRGRAGGRVPALRREEGHHPRRRAEPDRAGHRVRLLLLPRLLRAPRRRLRDHHGQLQPRDGLDRLRHLRPALLRAAHRRGRGRDRSRRSGGTARCTASSSSSAGRRP